MPRTKGSKNKINVQKQKQSQIVNVNINQGKEKKVVKRKPRAKKQPIQPPIIYDIGMPSPGKPTDNSIYLRPPIIGQVIPQIGRDSQAILPPNDTNVESVLAKIKNKTSEVETKRKNKILSDTGINEILNIPSKRKVLTDSSTNEILSIEPKIKETKDVATEPTKRERKPLYDLGAEAAFEIKPKEKQEVGTSPAIKQMTDTEIETVFESEKVKEPKILKFDASKVSNVKEKAKAKSLYIAKIKGMTPLNDLQIDKPIVQREPIYIVPKTQAEQKEE